jgi:hypothetical protein
LLEFLGAGGGGVAECDVWLVCVVRMVVVVVRVWGVGSVGERKSGRRGETYS